MEANHSELATYPKVSLNILRGRSSRKSREIKGASLLIGSGPDCDIQMRSPEVATHHCLVVREAQRVVVRKLADNVSLKQNGNPIVESELADDDILAVGPFELSVSIEERNAPPAASFPPLESADAPATKVKPPEEPEYDDMLRELDGFRAELSDQKSRIERDFQLLSYRETELSQLEKVAAEREAALQERERQFQDWQNSLQDKLNAVKQQSQSIDAQKHKLQRIRQRMVKHHSKRRERIASLAGNYHRKESQLKNVEQDLQAKISHWNRVSQDLESKQKNLDLDAENLSRQMEVFQSHQSKFRENWQRLEKEIERSRNNEQVLEKTRAELELERSRLEELERRLERSQSEVTGRSAQIESAEASLRSEEISLRERERILQDRSLYLDQKQKENAQLENELAERAKQHQRVEAEIQKRSTETELTSKLFLNKCEEERVALEQQRQQILRSRSQLDKEISELRSVADKLHEQRQQINERQNHVEKDRSQIKSMAEKVQQQRQEIQQQLSLQKKQAIKLRDIGMKVVREKKWLQEEHQKVARLQNGIQALLAKANTQQKQVLDAVFVYIREIEAQEDRDQKWSNSVRDANQQLAQIQLRISGGIRRLDGLFGTEARSLAGAADAAAGVVSINDWQASLLEELCQDFSNWTSTSKHLERLLADDSTSRQDQKVHRQLRNQQLDTLMKLVDECSTTSMQISDQSVTISNPHWDGADVLGWPMQAPPFEGASFASETPEYVPPMSRNPSPPAATMDSAEHPPVQPTIANKQMADLLNSVNHSNAAVPGPLPPSTTQETLAELNGHAPASGRQSSGRNASKSAERTISSEQLQVGQARLIDVLHEGTIATTFLAKMPEFEGPVALKIFEPIWTKDKGLLDAFEYGVRSLAAFSHPNVAQTFGFFRTEGRAGIVMEFVDGIRMGSDASFYLAPQDHLKNLLRALEAIEAAQRAGYIHHGITPNRMIMAKQGDLKIVGYGEPEWLGKIHRCEQGQRSTVFCAPEELEGSLMIDIRSDLYSIGKSFLYVMTNQAGTAFGKFEKSGYPRGIDHFIDRLTASDPRRRHRSPAEAIDALTKLTGLSRRSPAPTGLDAPTSKGRLSHAA